MALEALSSNEFLNFIIYDTISATPCNSGGHDSHNSMDTGFLSGNNNHALKPEMHQGNISVTAALDNQVLVVQKGQCLTGIPETTGRWRRQNLTSTTTVQQGGRKRRRKPRVCKNKEEAETQRMTHIAVERNRRRQMNEHLAVLRSLVPESYVQRGDQASIVGGAIDFVKELEHLLQSLEAQKLQILQAQRGSNNAESSSSNSKFLPPPFSQFFVYPQYIWSQMPHNYTSKTMAAIADIEVTLIETHANLRILSRRSPRQLSKLVTAFQTLYLTILHVNVTTLDELVLYSISAKLEEGCQLTSVDDIAGAIHHLLRIIEEEATLC